VPAPSKTLFRGSGVSLAFAVMVLLGRRRRHGG
jgi:hypothetical protein